MVDFDSELPNPMRNVVFVAAIGVLVGVVAGCASSTPSDEAVAGSPRTSDGALLTLAEEESRPVWRDWKAEAGRKSMPTRFDGVVRAFDYWEIDDTAVIDDVWSALFPVLDGLRARSGTDARRKSVQLLLEALEPDRGDRATRMDLTFLVSSSESDPFEGFACRLYRRLADAEVTPVLTILFLRDPARKSSPGEIWVWGAPGFVEPDPITALYFRDDSGWKGAVLSGLSFPKAGERPELSGGRAGRIAARVLTKSIWERFAGDAYLNSPQSGAQTDRDRPRDIPRALGLKVQDRNIQQVYSGTEFPPRADLDEL